MLLLAMSHCLNSQFGQWLGNPLFLTLRVTPYDSQPDLTTLRVQCSLNRNFCYYTGHPMIEIFWLIMSLYDSLSMSHDQGNNIDKPYGSDYDLGTTTHKETLRLIVVWSVISNSGIFKDQNSRVLYLCSMYFILVIFNLNPFNFRVFVQTLD